MKLALKLINTEIAHLEGKIETFEQCKLALHDVIKSGRKTLQEIALTRYTRCTLNLACKLNSWLEVLTNRRYDILVDLRQMDIGWVPYVKKCKLSKGFFYKKIYLNKKLKITVLQNRYALIHRA